MGGAGDDHKVPWRLQSKLTDPKIVKAFKKIAPASAVSVRGKAKTKPKAVTKKKAKPKPKKRGK